jgi:heat shock protein HtpX
VQKLLGDFRYGQTLRAELEIADDLGEFLNAQTDAFVQLLNKEELTAVIGHEVGHLRNRDVITMTLISVIPMIVYRIAWQLMFTRRSRNDSVAPWVLGVIAFAVYFLSNLLVLYLSRIREYYADKASVEFGNRPSALASALYKLTYGSAKMDKDHLHEVEGLKAFFILV